MPALHAMQKTSSHLSFYTPTNTMKRVVVLRKVQNAREVKSEKYSLLDGIYGEYYMVSVGNRNTTIQVNDDEITVVETRWVSNFKVLPVEIWVRISVQTKLTYSKLWKAAFLAAMPLPFRQIRNFGVL